jgi:hypothetical protein
MKTELLSGWRAILSEAKNLRSSSSSAGRVTQLQRFFASLRMTEVGK